MLKKVIYFFLALSFFSYGEQLDPYGACLTKVNKELKKDLKICEENFYKKMVSLEKTDIEKASDYAQMFRACAERAKLIYEMGKNRCEVLYRE